MAGSHHDHIPDCHVQQVLGRIGRELVLEDLCRMLVDAQDSLIDSHADGDAQDTFTDGMDVVTAIVLAPVECTDDLSVLPDFHVVDFQLFLDDGFTHRDKIDLVHRILL